MPMRQKALTEASQLPAHCLQTGATSRQLPLPAGMYAALTRVYCEAASSITAHTGPPRVRHFQA